jgi:hypothetical protein
MRLVFPRASLVLAEKWLEKKKQNSEGKQGEWGGWGMGLGGVEGRKTTIWMCYMAGLGENPGHSVVVDLNPLWGQTKWCRWGLCSSIRYARITRGQMASLIRRCTRPALHRGFFCDHVFSIWSDLEAGWRHHRSIPLVSCRVSAADIALNVLPPLNIDQTLQHPKHCLWNLCHWGNLSVKYELSMVASTHFWEPECLGLNPSFDTMAVWLWLSHWSPGS